MMIILFLVSLYAAILTMSVMHMSALVSECCDTIENAMLQELRARSLEMGTDYRKEVGAQIALISTGCRKEASRRVLPAQLWMCFLVLSCTFMDSTDFDEEFRKGFTKSTLDILLTSIQEVSLPKLKDLEAIILATRDRLGVVDVG